MRRNGPLRSLSRLLEPLLVGGEWTAAVGFLVVLQIVGFGLQLLLPPGVIFDDLSLGGPSAEAFQPWRFLTFLFVNHPRPLVGGLALALNLIVFGIVAGEAGQLLGTGRFLLFYAVAAAGAAVGGVLAAAGGEVYGAIGPVAGTIFAFGMANPLRRIYGKIPARLFAVSLALLLLGGHFAILAIGDPGTVREPWTIVCQAIGGGASAYLYFLARPVLMRRRQVREMFRWLEDLQAEQALREQVDALLEKISRDGMGSLSRDERRYLERASRHIQETKEREMAERRKRKKSENLFF